MTAFSDDKMGGLTRREWMAAMLGLPLASACRIDLSSRNRFGGEIIGANAALGHQLRDGHFSSEAEPGRAEVVIVGGGAAGLSAAWRLERAGVTNYRVLELEDVAGGTARSGQNAITRHPWGAHYLPCPLPHARAVIALLEEMGVATRGADGEPIFDETQLCRSPQERIFVGDRWYDGLWPGAGASREDQRQLAAFMAEMARFGQLRDGRGRRAFAVPSEHGSDDADITALDRLSMADWLEARGYSSSRLRWYVEYACRDDFGALLGETSAWAAIHYFASRYEHGRTAEFLTWPEGNGRLIAHLAGVAGARLQTGRAVASIRRLARGAEVLSVSSSTGKAERIACEHVVVALPRAIAARLVEPWRRDPPTHVAAFENGAWLVANLSMKRGPRSRGVGRAWDNVLYGSASLGYVVATHQLDPGGCAPGYRDPCSRRAPLSRDETVWTWYLPLTDRDPREARKRLLALDWRSAADLAIADLARAHPDVAECVSRLDVCRWGHAMPRPSVGFRFGKARTEALAALGDIHFAHTDLSGLPLFEEAQWHGIRAAEEILKARGLAYASLLD